MANIKGVMTHVTVCSMFFLLASSMASAQVSQCPAIARIELYEGGFSHCRCGGGLNNVTLTPPRGLTLLAVCNLRKYQGFADIPNSTAVNLDHYDSNSSIGNYYFRGSLRMTGIFRYEPSDGGDLFFLPAVPVDMPKSAIEPSFRDFKLVPRGKPSKYSIDKTVRAMGCAEARGEIVVKEIQIIDNDSEEAGAYPTSIDLLRISRYKPCKHK